VQSNENAPVSSGGSSGDVNQSNSSTANSYAKNKNESAQGIDQDQSSAQRQFAEQEGSACCNPCQRREPCPPPCDPRVLTRGALVA